MKVETLIPATWFYKEESQKTKLNYFLYEYACKLYEHIVASRKKALAKWKAERSGEQIAEFCAYYAKRMRLSVLDHLEGHTDGTAVYAEYVTDYCHANTSREDEAIRAVGGAAWMELLGNCAICVCRCLNERAELCDYFGRKERGGRLS